MLELFAATSKQPLAAAVGQLQVEGALTFDEFEESQYLGAREVNARLVALWRAGTAWVADELSSSIQAVLQSLSCYQHQHDRTQLAKVFGIYRKEDLEEMAEEYDPERRRSLAHIAARAVGRFHVLGMPCWYGSMLAGMWLLHPAGLKDEGGFVYMPLQDTPSAIGLGHLTRGTDEDVVVTSDPRVALRYSLRQMWDSTRTSPFTPFVCPKPTGEIRVMDTGARNVTYFPSELPLEAIEPWFKAAVQTPGSQTIMTWKMDGNPLSEFPKGTVAAMLRGLKNLAVPSHQAVGAYLLSRPLTDAGRLAHKLELSTPDQNLVRSFFTGDDGNALDRMFNATARPRQIDFNGKRVLESKAGWMCRDLLISNVIVHISLSETDVSTGKTVVTGTISSDGRVEHFREDRAVIKRDPEAWLDRLALSHRIWPRIDKNWGRHLLQIAYEFSRDNVRVSTSEKPFGWSDGTLRFPRFFVNADGVHRVQCSVFGPNVLPPDQLTANEFEALSDLNFAKASLAILGNLMRTGQGLHGYGIVVPSAPHVVARLGDALGLPAVKNPSIHDVMLGESRPLPLVATWSDDCLTELLKVRGPKNILTTVDARSFQLMSALPDWVRLPINNLANYAEITWLYHAVPRLLKTPPKPTDRFFEGIARVLNEWLSGFNPHHLLMTAASDLDRDLVTLGSNGSAGNRLVYLFRELHDAGILRAETQGSQVVIRHSDVIAACVSPVLSPADIPAMTQTLTNSGLLIGLTKTQWTISDTLWSMVGSFLKTKS